MKKIKRSKLVIIIAVIVGIALFGHLSNKAKAFDFSGWERGGSGYESAYQRALDQESPLILYFSTDWCGWCKKLNQIYLEASDVQAALDDILKVDINPDKGAAERKLQMKYGIRGYPAFLVMIPALKERPAQVHPFRSNGMLTTTDFVAAINISVERLYSNKAASLSRKQEYDEALRYFTKAQEYYRDDPQLQYNLGLTYLAMAQKDRSSDYLDKAEESYLAALKIEAGHEGAKGDLLKIEELRSQWKKEGLTSQACEKI